MIRRRRSPRRPPKRNGTDWRFIAATAAVAFVAFVVVLAWPRAEVGRLVSAPLDAPASAPTRASLACAVASVTDGDTLRCRDGLHIRLHAVAAREADETCSPGHPCPSASGAAATRELRRLVSGRTLACEPIGRSYDRVTAIYWTPSGDEVNCAMVRSGTTLLWDRFDRQARLCRTG